MGIEWTPTEEIVRFDENGNGVITGELVRCKDCKWSISCGYISTRSYKEWKDWFCADGERSET